MNLFYQPDESVFVLDEEESRHISKVLRLKEGDIIHVTNGKGLLQICRIGEVSRSVKYTVVERRQVERPTAQIIMGVAPTRKAERNEWMVEKMTEMGVDRIDFIITEHTHTEGINRVVNLTRLNRIAVSAMKQSQQLHLPVITVGRKFKEYIDEFKEIGNKLIAYVPDHETAPHVFQAVEKEQNSILLIGPEGDFTPAEIQQALEKGFTTVSLGLTRLRTETAAMAGCHALNMAHHL